VLTHQLLRGASEEQRLDEVGGNVSVEVACGRDLDASR